MVRDWNGQEMMILIIIAKCTSIVLCESIEKKVVQKKDWGVPL